MNHSDDIELFDNYLKGLLDKASLEAFEQRVATDSNFKRDLEDYIAAVKVIKTAGAGQHIRSVMAKNAKTVRLRYITGLSIAASIAIVIAFIVWPSGEPSHEKLFDAYFQPYPSIATSRSASEDITGTVYEQYTTGNYTKAIELLKQVPVKSDTLYFYSGISSLCLKNTRDALEALNSVDENSVFYQQVAWYCGLAYLLAGERENAKRTLASIGPLEYKYKEAQSILASL
ncbi:MAG: hypothetical protein ACOYXT_29145 [Bacteroidota bacterium]